MAQWWVNRELTRITEKDESEVLVQCLEMDMLCPQALGIISIRQLENASEIIANILVDFCIVDEMSHVFTDSLCYFPISSLLE